MAILDSTVKPKHNAGDFISWVCDSCGEVHKGKIAFAVSGVAYDCPHYEVQGECCGEEKTMYVDEYDVLNEDISLAGQGVNENCILLKSQFFLCVSERTSYEENLSYPYS